MSFFNSSSTATPVFVTSWPTGPATFTGALPPAGIGISFGFGSSFGGSGFLGGGGGSSFFGGGGGGGSSFFGGGGGEGITTGSGAFVTFS